MRSSDISAYFVAAGALAALLLLGACERAPEAAAFEQANNALPPAIIPPSEVPNLAAPPSYEVGIASAAADRNRAKAKCAEKPERIRAMCEAEADVDFANAEAELEDLRGNQQ
jgi:hypothetical protein